MFKVKWWAEDVFSKRQEIPWASNFYALPMMLMVLGGGIPNFHLQKELTKVWEVVFFFQKINQTPDFFSAASRCRLKVVPEEELPRVDEVSSWKRRKRMDVLTLIINKHCLLHEPIPGYFSYCSVFLFCFVLFCLFFFRCESSTLLGDSFVGFSRISGIGSWSSMNSKRHPSSGRVETSC